MHSSIVTDMSSSQDNFDEFTRRQYVAKAPTRNPFGTEEEPKKFAEFDIFTKLRVLCQLSRWTFINTNRLREAMPADADHLEWVCGSISLQPLERLTAVVHLAHE